MGVEVQEKKANSINLDTMLEILGNPTRRVILSKLAKVPHSTSELAKSLDISRQAVHSQLNILKDYGIIEEIDMEKRGGKYRIKSNLSLRVDITPDYYHIKYNLTKSESTDPTIQIKQFDETSKYKKINAPDKKIRYLGNRIKSIEDKIRTLEKQRKDLIQAKECFIVELKSIMEGAYEKKLGKKSPNLDNLEKEIFYTLFFNTNRYFNRINLDDLLEDLFFSDMDFIRRDQNKVSIKHLLRDLSQFMDFLKEDEDSWFFDL
ncbi:MAG: helix-turn-helix domain-containing protein [Candidatus Lokiarchaeota archaeon]|nr:helix-turn-helix domain-containing protein [Candidatus Lokiarchaeota archaeon]MBD3341579.1 helix-turn-helix domain-containing protein [Candidatus Lokiarchaeota archaeon]